MSTEHNAWNTYRRATRWANRSTIPLDDAIVAVSDETRTSMDRRSTARCVAVQHGIDVEAVASQARHREAVRAELGIDDDALVIGTVANYRAQKDYPNLLRAAAELQRDGVPCRVVAVGQGPLESDIIALHRDLGLGDAVLLTGYRADATRVMSAFDVFTVASAYEGMPVAVMEALALGLPVVATRVGGIAESLGDGDALLVPPGDPTALAAGWRRVVESPALRADLAERSLERAGDFDVRRCVDAYEATYRRLARKPAAHVEPQPPPRPPPSQRASQRPSQRGSRSPRPGPGLAIRPATPDDRPRILELLTRTLGWTGDPRHAELFAWKHDQNPVGPSPMWVAADNDRIVGLRAFMRWNFVRDGEILHAVRAVDTATDPEYQGRGLFTAMTLQGLDALAGQGIDFVFNTPNPVSLPGYLKMGWRVVGRVPVAVRPRNPTSALTTITSKTAAELGSLDLDLGSGFPSNSGGEMHPAASRALATDRTDSYLQWRYGAPMLRYRLVESDAGALVIRGRRRGAARELVLADVLGAVTTDPTTGTDAAAVRALRQSGFDHLLRAGAAAPARGFVGLPGGGPLLTFRALNREAVPPLANWRLTMGDVELF